MRDFIFRLGAEFSAIGSNLPFAPLRYLTLKYRVSLSTLPPLPSSAITFQKYNLPGISLVVDLEAVSVRLRDRAVTLDIGSQSLKVNLLPAGQMQCLWLKGLPSRSEALFHVKPTVLARSVLLISGETRTGVTGIALRLTCSVSRKVFANPGSPVTMTSCTQLALRSSSIMALQCCFATSGGSGFRGGLAGVPPSGCGS